MGEARSKRRAHAAMPRAHSWCIYCGNPAITVEHMPPRMMFLGKQRPKGLEFPTCRECNEGTSHADLVASLLSRTFARLPSDQHQTDLVKLLNAVGNNIPGLLQEMYVGPGGQKIARRSIPKMPAGTRVLRVSGPLVSSHMATFAAKFGFALHFEAIGKPVPMGGGVQALWFSNVQAFREELPSSIIKMLPSRRTLKQGKKQVSDQFEYSFLTTEEGSHSVSYGVFGSSFAVLAASALDRSEFIEQNADRFPVIKPGDLRRP
jgi:hypothetical protein